MADPVDINELDASDLGDILTEVKGTATKVKNVASARKELESLLESKGLVLNTDDEGNFVLNPKKAAKGKVKTKAPEPEPEEEEAEEAEAEEETEEEAEEEAEEPPPPAKKGKTAPAPKAKVKAKAEPEEEAEEEAEEEEAPKAKTKVKAKAPSGDGTKRAPPPREPNLKDDMKITIVNKAPKFAEGSFRARKWDVLKKSKTVGDFMKGCESAELPSARGYLTVCIKAEYITVG